jgi:hypothetical protein
MNLSHCASEAIFCGGVHQQRLLYANSIHGQGRPSMLGYLSRPGCFSLHWKILDLGVGFNAGFTGVIPRGVVEAQTLRSLARSDEIAFLFTSLSACLQGPRIGL